MLMRLIYVDEAGISLQEPYIVVAAVIAVGDTDVTPVSRHLGLHPVRMTLG
jgi:hypothetical protein